MNGDWSNRETFKDAPNETKFDMIHDGLKAIHGALSDGKKRMEDHDDRIGTLENSATTNKVIAGVIGVFAAIGVVMAKAKFW